MKQIVWAASVAKVLTIGVGFSAPAAAADSWAGKYTGHLDSYRWAATIAHRAAGVYGLRVSVASRMPECSGDFSGSAKLVGSKLVIDDEDCSLTISKRGPKGIRIEEKQCNSHGAACGFDSTLQRK